MLVRKDAHRYPGGMSMMPDPASPSSSPLDDVRRLTVTLLAQDGEGRAAVRQDSGDRLTELAEWYRRIREKPRSAPARPGVVIFAGAHGVARQGVSPHPLGATAEAVASLGTGDAPLSRLCASLDLGLKAFDLALEHPTADITEGAALDERACAATIAFGMEAAAGGVDLLVLGALGIGASVGAAAIFATLFGGEAAEWLQHEADAPEHARRRAEEAAARAQLVHRGHLDDPLDLLSRLGGRELAALAGAILAARVEKVPVVLDGQVAFAAAALLHRLAPAALDHCVLAHRLCNPRQDAAARGIGLVPLLDLGLFEGDGRAGALTAGLVRAATA